MISQKTIITGITVQVLDPGAGGAADLGIREAEEVRKGLEAVVEIRGTMTEEEGGTGMMRDHKGTAASVKIMTV